MWNAVLAALQDFINDSGLAWIFQNFNNEADGIYAYKNVIMILVALVLIYLAIKKEYEPLLLLPIAFGMLLVNLPLSGIMDGPYVILSDNLASIIGEKTLHGSLLHNAALYGEHAVEMINTSKELPAGLLYNLYMGNKLGIFPPLIFMGVGALTDFGPLLANPKSFLLGAAAQFGIFLAFFGALALKFSPQEAASIAIIGGADGPTAIFTTIKLAPHLLGPIAVAAYSYMALVPIIQPPIMRLLTTKEERLIKMDQLRPISQLEKILFPIIVTILVILILPSTAPLIGMLMFGNLIKVCGVTEKLADTASNALMYIVTIFLGITVGATTSADSFLNPATLGILLLGLVAFCFGTGAGVMLGKLMCKLSGGKINPLIGAAGVSAVPMAARVVQKVGREEDPTNFLLMHAMGPNVAGVIGSAVAAGVFLSLYLK
ncbi:MAG: glutaconyl-CoA decarboxylase subunit beta [Firmicutes bacterium HGW-Firmicutes-7]|nr:MAG: glutaconyl-CoA decarboxylase subunit beta [Firmicutes bacterium HGW-Firmicutes-7]